MIETLLYLSDDAGNLLRLASPNEIWSYLESERGEIVLDGGSYSILRVMKDETGRIVAISEVAL